MKKKTLIVDIDDTIITLGPHWIYRLNERYGTNVDYDKIDQWDVSKFFPTLSKDQVDGIIKESDFYSSVPIKYDAYYYLKQLKREGYKIVLCTSSHYTNVSEKLEQCVFKWFDFISWEDVIICRDKSCIKGDVIIDDGLHNILNFDGIKILIDKPYNRLNPTDIKLSYYRVNNWKEIYEVIHMECPIK